MSATMQPVDQMFAEYEWLPESCPAWCDGDHAEVLVQIGNDASCWRDAQEHQGHHLEQSLWEVRNPMGDYVMRSGPSRYELSLRERPRHANGAQSCADVVRVEVEQSDGVRAGLDLLPSEARSLAARLVRLADVMELER